MASQKRSANRPKFDRKPIDLDDLTNASSFSGIRDVIESHFGRPETSDSATQPAGPRAVPAPGAMAASVFETDPTRLEYVWEPEEAPISVRLGAELIDRLEKESLEIFRAITNRGSEIGGFLLGHVLPGAPLTVVVEDYEPVACAYSLGPTFLLSGEEQQRMREAITRRRAAGDLAAVGFFRSNTRPALVMTEEDSVLFDRLFPEEHNIFLLAKPFSRKPCQGAIFVREDRKVRCEASYLEFPFSRAELEKCGELEAAIRVPPASAGRVTPIRPAAAPSEPEWQKPVAPVKLEPEPVAAIPAPVESRPTPASAVRAPEAPERAAPIDRNEAPGVAEGRTPVQPRIEARVEEKAETRVETKIEPKVEPRVPPGSEARIEPKVQAGASLTSPPIGTQPAESTAETRRPPTSQTGSGIAAGTKPVWRFKPGLASSIERKVEPAIKAEPAMRPPVQAEPEAEAKPSAPPAAEAGRASEQVRPPAQAVPQQVTPPPQVVPPPQVKPPAQVVPPPQVKPPAQAVPQQVTPPAQVVPPQVRPAAQVLPQQVKPAAQVAPPQVRPAAQVLPQQVRPAAQVVPPPQVKPAAQVVPPQVRPAAQVLPQQVKPPAQVVPPPQVKPAAQVAPPQVRPAAQVVPPPQVKPPAQAVPDFRFGAEAAEPERKGRRWLLVVAAVVVAAVVLFVLLRPSHQPGAGPAAPARADAGSQSSSLALRVEGTDSGVMIRWDGSAPAIAAARHGRLSVVDGGRKTEFDLGSAELREGAYAYKPRADDLTIRLELTDAPAGQNAFGTLRILGATRMRGPASR